MQKCSNALSCVELQDWACTNKNIVNSSIIAGASIYLMENDWMSFHNKQSVVDEEGNPWCPAPG